MTAGLAQHQARASDRRRVGVGYRDGKADQRETIIKRVKDAHPEQIDGLKVVRIDDKEGRKFYLEDGSWLLVRFSGTEPLLRIYTETTSPERVERILATGHQITGV